MVYYPTGIINGLVNGQSLGLNYTISNAQSCWYDYNNTNTTISNCNLNTTFTYISGLNSIKVWANDSSNNIAYNSTSWSSSVTINSVVFNASSYETAQETFSINATNMTTAILIYNGTSYTASVSGDTATRTIQIPNSIGNKSFYWNVNSGVINSTTYYQYVNATLFSICNSTSNKAFVNYTFKDENTLADINGTVSSTFTYWLGDGTINKTLTFTNTTENKAYAFCLIPVDKTLNLVQNIQYASTGYPTRVYNIPSAIALTNNTNNKTLYLLASADGIYVTIRVVNAANQNIVGAVVNATTSTGLVGSGTTDDAGSITLWLDPDLSTTFTVAASGFAIFTTILTPTQTQYTFTIGSSTEAAAADYTKGITYTILQSNEYLASNNTYNFNFTINTTYWTISYFGFNITNGSDIIASNASTANGGILSLSINTSNNQSFYVTPFWIVNSSTIFGTPKVYTIESGAGGDYSILRLITDFNTYVSGNGLFGLKKGVGLNLIIFLIIFITTGIFSYRHSLENPLIIVFIIFSLTLIFDVVLGLISYPANIKMPGFATFIIGLILTVIGFKEVTGR